MSFQMGHDSYLKKDPTSEELDKIRSSLHERFDLILIADHLPESLILLRHELCLSINDIASLLGVGKIRHILCHRIVFGYTDTFSFYFN